MNAAHSYGAGYGGAPRQPTLAGISAPSLFGRLYGLVRENFGANLLFLSSVVIGFFHGWLKLRYRTPLTTFAFDIPLTLALLSAILSIPKHGSVFPSGRVSSALKALLLTTALYGIAPFGVPPVISLASFRGWCFIPLIFLLGYHLTKSTKQLEILTFLLIGLGVVTAIYGIRQTPEEVMQMMALDKELQFRLQNNFYGSSTGSQFRHFSTFVSSAAFGGTMAFCAMFALSRLSTPGCTWKERLLLLACTVPMAYGVMLSGSRSSLVMFMLALLATAWYRRNVLQLFVGPAIVAIAFKGVATLTKGASLERYYTLLDPSVVLHRYLIVYYPALDYLSDHLLGGGLGRSSHGVPFILGRLGLIGDFQFYQVDGDLGRLAVDMGIIGLIVFASVLLIASLDAFRLLKLMRDTPLATVALPSGAWFLIAVFCVPIGSPFLAIPIGPLTWYFLGALVRMAEEYEGGVKGSLPVQNEALASFLDKPKKQYFYAGEIKKSRKPVTPRSTLVAGRDPGKQGRFLFRRPPATPAPSTSRLQPQIQPVPANESRPRRPRL